MMIGIIDMDLFINNRQFFPNPEVMLLSGYHKQKGDIVHLLLDGKTIDIYEKIYICRNKMKPVKFPEELYSRPNVECSGMYFTNDVIAPIKEEVFAAAPDKSIYDKYVRYWGNQPIKGVKNLERAKYVSYRKGFSPLSNVGSNYLYDYDLGAEEDLKGLAALYEKGYFKKMNSYYPIQATSTDMVIKWIETSFLTNHVRILYPDVFTWKDLYTIKPHKSMKKIHSYITNKTRFSKKEELDEVVISTLDKMIFCMVNDMTVQFKLSPKMKYSVQFRFLKALSDWSRSVRQPSFYEFCCRNQYDKALAETFIEEHPNVADWFYLSPHKFKKEGGIWLNDRRTN